MNTHCVICGNPILPHHNLRETHKTCGSSECVKAWHRQWEQEHRGIKRDAKLQGDAVACAICGKRFEVLQHTHLRKHGLTIAQYHIQYPDAPLMTDKMKGLRGNGSLARSRYLSYNGKEPDTHLFELLTGLLLGDGSLELGPSKTNARYAEGGKNEEYLRWKYDLLSRYFPTSLTEKLSSPHTKSGKSYHGWWIKTGVHPLLTEWHIQWYADRKIVPQELIERYLTEFALAVWFCDDGHMGQYNAWFYTFAFSIEEVEFLASHLKSKFKLTGEVRKNKFDQPFLWFCAKEKRSLLKIIAPFQIPGMEYKYNERGQL